MTYPFSKAFRLRTRRDFLSLRSGAERFLGTFLVVDRKPNRLGQTRLGIVVSRHFGKANHRNRFKRLVREAFRLQYPNFPKGIDLVVKPRKSALQATLQDIQRELQKSD